MERKSAQFEGGLQNLQLLLRVLLLAILASLSVPGVSSPATITSGETHADSIGSGASRPWTFVGNQGDRILVTAVTRTGAVNTTIRLRRLGSMTDETQSGCDDRLDHVLGFTDSYTLFVEDCALTAIGTYSITFLKILPDSMTAAGDPDGGAIASGQTITGQVNTVSDFDGFQFSANSGERIVVVVSSTYTALPLDTNIRLYPPDGAPQVAETGCDDRLESQLGAAGVYTIVVEDCSLIGTGMYDLTFVKLLPDSLTSPEDPDGGTIASGQTRTGLVNTRSDVDGFQFSANPGERVVVTAGAVSGTLDSRIRIYPPGGGAQLAESACGDRLDLQLALIGVYTILIEDCTHTGAGYYKITFAKILPDSMTSSVDPNGGRIASGQTLSGRINPRTDFDGFQFSANAGEQILVTVARIVSGLDPRLRLYPPNGGPQEADSGCEDHLVRQLGTTGVYTIFVEDCGLGATGDYNINFLKNSPDSTGIDIASGQTLSRHLDPPGAFSDVFHFFANAGERILVSAVPTSGNLDTRLLLYPPNGGPLEASSDCVSLCRCLNRQLASTGVYTLLVEVCYLLEDRSGDYNVTFVKIPGAISYAEDLDGGLVDTNSRPPYPTSLPSSGTIGTPTDIDVYQFYASAGDTVAVFARRDSGTITPRLRLYSPGGNLLADPGSGIPNIDGLVVASNGLYSVSLEGTSPLHTGAYLIRVSKYPAAPASGIYSPQPPVGGRVWSGGGWGAFRWESVLSDPDSVRYDLYLGNDIVEPLPRLYADLDGNSAPVPALSSGSVYCWQVVAFTSTETIASPVWWFLASDATAVGPESTPFTPTSRQLSFPNPFTSRSAISYSLSKPDFVRLTIYDVRGRLVATLVRGWHPSGTYSITWGTGEPGEVQAGSGVYVVRLGIGSEVTSQKMVLAK